MRRILLAGVILAAGVLAGCTGGDQVQTACRAEGPSGPVKVGTLLPQSGALSSLGPDAQRAVELAVAEVNEAGGVLGEPAEVVHQDSATDPRRASQALDELVRQGVLGIVGPLSSNVTANLASPAEQAGVALLSPGADGQRLVELAGNGWVMRLLPREGLQGLAMADLIEQEGLTTASVVHLDTPYGHGFLEAFERGFVDLGQGQIASSQAVLPGREDPGAVLENATRAQPEAVVYVGFTGAGVPLFQAAEERGLLDRYRFFASEGLLTRSFVDAMGVNASGASTVAGVLGTTPMALLGSPQAGGFHERFEAAYGHTAEIFAAQAYDATVALLLAAAGAGTDDPGAVHACLPVVWNAPGIAVSPEELGEALDLARDGEDVDLRPVTGALDWDAVGEPAGGTYATWTVTEAGEIDVVETGITVRR